MPGDRQRNEVNETGTFDAAGYLTSIASGAPFAAYRHSAWATRKGPPTAP